jgi:hypothetical protein
MKSLLIAAFGLLVSFLPALAAPAVTVQRVPGGGIQPQAVTGADGTTHLIYLVGKPEAADVFYVRIGRDGKQSAPIQVNQKRGVVIATGTIRGAHLAVGKQGRAHVVWNGNAQSLGLDHKDAPLFYTRLNDAGTAFEPERNVITFAYGLDGGSSVAADDSGKVFVVWHGRAPDAPPGEQGRAVFLAQSTDDGKIFARERSISPATSGVCPCCGLKAFAAPGGVVAVLYRLAQGGMVRDTSLLLSCDGGARFEPVTREAWKVGTCPMSSASLGAGPSGLLAAWETAGQVHGARLDAASGEMKTRFTPAGAGKRKHPVIVVNPRGETLLVWTEGTGWNRGGSIAWQVFDADGRPTAEQGTRDGLPVWGLATAFVAPDGSFVVVY